jgi:16S rRNA pseudouridine516 synthase
VKLNRLVARHAGIGRNQARLLIAASRVTVDGIPANDGAMEVDRFHEVLLDGRLIRPADRRLRLMVHKPRGVLSATSDAAHTTVIDMIDHPEKHTLHLAGRLDRDSSGLVLLTNDGRWSKLLMDPAAKVSKIYQVETREPIPPAAVAAFAGGFYFHTENLTTRPALLEIIGPRLARVTLHEGRYHQIKRMFHRVGNRVTALHRESIGDIRLPGDLGPGQWREIPEADFRL